MVQRAVVVVVVIFSAYVVAQPGQTFQSTVFDIPAELPSEDYAVLSQLDDAPTQKVQDPLKPKKINKAALNLPQVQPTLPTVPQPPPVQPLQPPPQPATPAPFTLPTHPAFPTFTFPTHPPFTLPTHPTIAPFTLPGAPTPPPPPFVLPTHPTMAPFTFPTHPTFAPFTFPTHPTFAPYTAAPPPFGPQSSQEPLQPQTGQAPQPNQGFQQIGTQAQVPQTPTVQPQFGGLPQQPNQPQVQQPPQHPLFPPHHQFPQPTGQQQQQQYGQLQQPQFGQQQQFQQTQQVQQPQFGQQQQFQQTQQVQQQQIQNQQQQQFGAQYPPQQQVPPAQYHHTFGESQFSQQGQLQGQNQNQQQQVQQQQVSQQPFFHQHQLPQHPLFQQQGLPQQQGPPQQQQQQPNQGNQPQQVFPQQQFQQHQHFPQQQGVQQSQLSRQQLLQRTEGPQHRPIVQPPPQQQQLQLQQSIDARPQQFTKPVSTNQQQGVPQRRFEQVVVAGAPVTVAPQPLPLPSPQLPPILSPLNLQVQEGAALVQPVLPGENAEALDGGQVEKVSSSTPNRGTLWFKDDFDISACQKNLSAIAEKFSAKFPLYLQKTGKDIALAGLVQQRLIECERKQTATHWDKVDGLLAKIALSKSEESECRGGLVQERISCVNLINYACQFIDPTFIFRLVPARITIQEARQAEAGAEKCRKVVRLVKKRLEG